jgi:hypothetical protein
MWYFTKIRLLQILILLLLFVTGKDCIAQKEADNWYFGLALAMNLNTGNPVTDFHLYKQ